MRRFSPADLRDVLKEAGIRPGHTVLIHSHLPAFGLFEGGPAALIATLAEAVGAQGTLVMPSFTMSFPKTRFWELETTPSETGVLTEAFRKTPGVLRSLHPIHSVAAMGAGAAELAGSWCASSFGPGSAFEKLYDRDAWLLCAGVGAERLTFVHYVEEREQVPYRARKSFPGTVRRGGAVDPRLYSMYARDLRFKVDIGRFPEILAGLGLGRTLPLPYGSLHAWRARQLFAAVQGLLREDPGALLAPGAPLHALQSGEISCTP
ncbi:MAG: AAC(3) family N-acetyltransferase [Elusimicrobia bacterium]|nr:AAC(3) family N-acetyltransferase [Elusimicrobiota bacterium]